MKRWIRMPLELAALMLLPVVAAVAWASVPPAADDPPDITCRDTFGCRSGPTLCATYRIITGDGLYLSGTCYTRIDEE